MSSTLSSFLKEDVYRLSLRSRRLEVVGERENGRAPVFSYFFQAPAVLANTGYSLAWYSICNSFWNKQEKSNQILINCCRNFLVTGRLLLEIWTFPFREKYLIAANSRLEEIRLWFFELFRQIYNYAHFNNHSPLHDIYFNVVINLWRTL